VAEQKLVESSEPQITRHSPVALMVCGATPASNPDVQEAVRSFQTIDSVFVYVWPEDEPDLMSWCDQNGCEPSQVALLVSAEYNPSAVRSVFPHALFLGLSGNATQVDLMLQNPGEAEWKSIYEYAKRQWKISVRAQDDLQKHQKTVRRQQHQIKQLTDIGIALSAERTPARLLERILSEARSLANCEAGSLYLLREQAGGAESELVFKLAQNDKIQVPFKEKSIPLSKASLVGYVASTGQELIIDNAYAIGADKPYSFNPRFDLENGYKTHSLLVIPMRNHKGRVIGALQFINRSDASGNPVVFDEPVIELLRALSSQAALAIEKNLLIQEINELFESFVQASVKTIEQRDPATSGHSFRVAETTTALMTALPLAGVKRFAAMQITPSQLKEIRYAALLHDFGKVAVRENILTKARKLSDERLELYCYRIELQKERLRNRALKEEMAELHERPDRYPQIRRAIQQKLNQALNLLDEFLEAIQSANNPTILAAGAFEHLEAINQYEFCELDGRSGQLLRKEDLAALSVKKGSLTLQERQQIEDHVVHTRDFLSVLLWPQELAQVPDIAGAHHEKLDGSGYPLGLTGDQIPLPSRAMTVCDIYDALTAMDRPYKASVSTEVALNILCEEVSLGLLDKDMVDIFISSRVYGVVDANYKGPLKPSHERRKLVSLY